MEEHNQGDDGQEALQPAETFPGANICIENVRSLRDSVVHLAGPSLHSTPNNATNTEIKKKNLDEQNFQMITVDEIEDELKRLEGQESHSKVSTDCNSKQKKSSDVQIEKCSNVDDNFNKTSKPDHENVLSDADGVNSKRKSLSSKMQCNSSERKEGSLFNSTDSDPKRLTMFLRNRSTENNLTPRERQLRRSGMQKASVDSETPVSKKRKEFKKLNVKDRADEHISTALRQTCAQKSDTSSEANEPIKSSFSTDNTISIKGYYNKNQPYVSLSRLEHFQLSSDNKCGVKMPSENSANEELDSKNLNHENQLSPCNLLGPDDGFEGRVEFKLPCETRVSVALNSEPLGSLPTYNPFPSHLSETQDSKVTQLTPLSPCNFSNLNESWNSGDRELTLLAPMPANYPPPNEMRVSLFNWWEDEGSLSEIPKPVHRRERWSQEAKLLVYGTFRNYIEERKGPGLHKCKQLINQSPLLLQGRTPAQVNSLINNWIYGKSPKPVDIGEFRDASEFDVGNRERGFERKRWGEEAKQVVRESFSDCIDQRRMPGLAKCQELVNKYPQLFHDRTAAQVNSLVSNWIHGKSEMPAVRAGAVSRVSKYYAKELWGPEAMRE